MKFHQLLVERRKVVLDDWLRRIGESYPAGNANFLGNGKNQFANPTGSVLAEGIEALLDALLEGAGREELNIVLDTPVRLRAVQAFTPGQAVKFVFDLKPAVRKALAGEVRKGRLASDLAAFEDQIDNAALVAFDAYMGCREQLLRLRTSEVRLATERLLERAGLDASELTASPACPSRFDLDKGKE